MKEQTMHLLEVQNLSKRFPQNPEPVLDQVSFKVEAGELFGLLGPSGCGKTTLLRTIAGFESLEQGKIFLESREINNLPPEKRAVGIVFQDYALFPHLNVEKNIMFAQRYGRKKLGPAEQKRKTEELLELLQLSAFARRLPHQLSGGQQQRAALARALAADPSVLLLDEPFSSLDAALRESTRREIRDILKKAGINTILVTHDQEEALAFCDRIAVMRQGRIEQIGEPEEIYLRPKTPFVAHFLGRANMLLGLAKGAHAETRLGKIPITPQAEGEVMLSIRPEHLAISRLDSDQEEAGYTHAEILSREYHGHDLSFRIRVGNAQLLAHTGYMDDFQPGDMVKVRVREQAVVLHGHSEADQPGLAGEQGAAGPQTRNSYGDGKG